MDTLLLWRFSTAAQVVSVLMIMAFFLVIARSTARRGIGWWVAAWVANALAMAVTVAFWLAQPDGIAASVTTAGYFFFKTLFLVLMVIGTLAFARPNRAAPRRRWLLAAVGVYAAVSAVLASSIEFVGVAQASAIALVFGFGAWLCLKAPGQGLGWLALGFALRAALALAEALAYGVRGFAPESDLAQALGTFLAAHSLFDTGAEWAIAFGCVLAIAHRTQSDLVRSNAELEAAHRELQAIAERDPLTGLSNRRMLPVLLQRLAHRDGWLLFFDLDGFKRINDGEGHFTGDACLKRFARALRETFDGDDAIVRFAGDEFVVATRAHSEAALAALIDALRGRLAKPEGETPVLRFSVGAAPLRAGADPESSLREADAAMYRQKAARPGARTRPRPLDLTATKPGGTGRVH
jgi:diguanylate cyclase (GGDEF)-like protein